MIVDMNYIKDEKEYKILGIDEDIFVKLRGQELSFSRVPSKTKYILKLTYKSLANGTLPLFWMVKKSWTKDFNLFIKPKTL